MYGAEIDGVEAKGREQSACDTEVTVMRSTAVECGYRGRDAGFDEHEWYMLWGAQVDSVKVNGHGGYRDRRRRGRQPTGWCVVRSTSVGGVHGVLLGYLVKLCRVSPLRRSTTQAICVCHRGQGVEVPDVVDLGRSKT